MITKIDKTNMLIFKQTTNSKVFVAVTTKYDCVFCCHFLANPAKI